MPKGREMRNDKLSYQAKQKSLPKRFPKKIGVSAGDHSGEVFLSVIALCFNELENIPVFLQEVRYHLENCCSFEVIFINDGSTDGSAIRSEERRVGEQGRPRRFEAPLRAID